MFTHDCVRVLAYVVIVTVHISVVGMVVMVVIVIGVIMLMGMLDSVNVCVHVLVRRTGWRLGLCHCEPRQTG